jgi:hypothetical protein
VVVVEIVTDCLDVNVPAAGEKVGVTAVFVVAFVPAAAGLPVPPPAVTPG